MGAFRCCPTCQTSGAASLIELPIELHDVQIHSWALRCRCGQLVFTARVVADALVDRGLRTGEEMRWVREVAGLACSQLAEMLGVVPETVQQWEAAAELPAAVSAAVATFYRAHFEVP